MTRNANDEGWGLQHVHVLSPRYVIFFLISDNYYLQVDYKPPPPLSQWHSRGSTGAWDMSLSQAPSPLPIHGHCHLHHHLARHLNASWHNHHHLDASRGNHNPLNASKCVCQYLDAKTTTTTMNEVKPALAAAAGAWDMSLRLKPQVCFFFFSFWYFHLLY